MGSFQTTVGQRAETLPPPGSRYGGDPTPPRSYMNDAPNVPGVTDVAITVQNSTAYQYEVEGVPVTFTSDASATAAEIRDGLIADHVAQQAAFPNSPIAKTTAVASGNDVRITETNPELGAVNVTESDANLALTTVTAHANEEPMDAGIGVMRGAHSDRSAVLPFAGGEFLGIVERYAVGAELETPTTESLYEALSHLPVGYRGQFVVRTEEAVSRGDNVFVRHVATTTNPNLGHFRNDNDGGNATQITGARWETTTTAAGRAVLSINLA